MKPQVDLVNHPVYVRKKDVQDARRGRIIRWEVYVFKVYPKWYAEDEGMAAGGCWDWHDSFKTKKEAIAAFPNAVVVADLPPEVLADVAG